MLNVVIELHYLNLFLILALGLITGIWGLILYFRKKTETISRPWRIALIITAADGLLQGILGVTLLLLGQKPGTGTDLYYLHYVYGGIVALAIPVALTYATGGKKPRRDVLIYSIAALILFAAGFRAWMTGPVHWP
jgi:heme A synthase